MINGDVLRIIIAKGAGDGTLKKISKCIDNDMSYSLNDICNNVNLCALGIKQEVARNIYESKESFIIRRSTLFEIMLIMSG